MDDEVNRRPAIGNNVESVLNTESILTSQGMTMLLRPTLQEALPVDLTPRLIRKRPHHVGEDDREPHAIE